VHFYRLFIIGIVLISKVDFLSLFRSNIEQHNLWVFNAFFNLAEEEDSLSSVNNAMVIGKGDVHDGSCHDCAANNDWADLRCVEAEDCALWHVHDRGTHHGSEDTSISNGESSSGQVFEGDLAVASSGCQVCEAVLKVGEAHVLGVSNDWYNESCWG